MILLVLSVLCLGQMSNMEEGSQKMCRKKFYFLLSLKIWICEITNEANFSNSVINSMIRF